MRLIQKILAGASLFIGVPLLLLGILIWFDTEETRSEKINVFAGSLFLGLPPTGLGGFLIWNLMRTNPDEKRLSAKSKEQQFLQLLQETGGGITPIRLASETGMSLEESKAYLDEKAKQLNATFDVSEEGGITYRFHI